MIRFVYAVKDSLTEFKSPFIAENDAVAARNFTNLVNADVNEVSLAPQYFDLYCLGTYDTEKGLIQPLKEGVKMVCSGSSVKKEDKDAIQK